MSNGRQPEGARKRVGRGEAWPSTSMQMMKIHKLKDTVERRLGKLYLTCHRRTLCSVQPAERSR